MTRANSRFGNFVNFSTDNMIESVKIVVVGDTAVGKYGISTLFSSELFLLMN
jgi:hypothetical protein